MKKTKKALASLAIASMALTSVPFNAFAAGTVPTRIAGVTAEQTAVQIAEQTGYTGTAILASSTSYGMVDALTAGPLATSLKAPILLTGAGSTLNADTKAELTKLSVKTVYVTSGTAVIKQGVLDELAGMGITVVQLGGIDRSETSVNIAKKMTGVTKVAVANGLADALSIASVAAAANEPILLTNKDALPSSVSSYLTSAGITTSDVIGGTGVISDAVKAALPGATRHFGTSAYDTNNQVIQDFASSLKFDNVYVANGQTGIDALAGAPLAAQTNSAIVLTDGTVPAAASFVHGKLTSGAVVTALGGAAVVSDAVRTGVINGTAPAQGNLAVTSVSAISADGIKVVFNQAPADTSKVTFDVSLETTPVTVTTTWNAAKTEATLSPSANYAEGNYTIKVKNDTTDLGSSTVSITQQKIAKINITSAKLAVVTSGATQKGYATYQVLDQYGNDITSDALAANLTFQSSVSDNTQSAGVKGLLTLSPAASVNVLSFSSVTISGFDSTTGVSVSANLPVSTQVGTLNSFQLTTLSNPDNAVFTAGDSTVFYAGYTATDLSGNQTNKFDLIKAGLINGATLTTSSSYVTATLDTDPSDSSKAVIKVQNTASADDITMDMPITITAMTWSGTNSTMNITLKKASKVDKIVLMNPAYNIAKGDNKEIPFVAYDQNGVQMTKASDLSDVNISGNGFTKVENVDGTLSLMFHPTVKGTTTLTATTPTGKYSSITINVQDTALAKTLQIDSASIVTTMEAPVGGNAAVQNLDTGYGYVGFSVKDQYDRDLNITNGDLAYITATGDGTVMDVDGTNNKVNGSGYIELKSKANGSGWVRFDLYDETGTKVDTKTVNFNVVTSDKISGYSMDTVANPIYTIELSTFSAAAANKVDLAYAANPVVYGKTSSGTKVILAGTPITGVYSSSGDFEAVDDTTGAYLDPAAAAAVAPDNVGLVAKKFADLTKTAGSTVLTAVVKDYEGKYHSVTTPVSSSTTKPAPSAVYISSDTSIAGVSVNDLGDTVTLDQKNVAAVVTNAGLNAGATHAIARYYGTSKTASSVYFYGKDQYGTKAGAFSQFIVVSDKITHAGVTTDNGTPFAVNQTTGVITQGPAALAAGDSEAITISAVSVNGLVKTMKIVINN